MMAEKEDLGLSLSLNFTEMRDNKNTESSSDFSFIGKICWNLQIPSSVPEQSSETMPLFKGIDVNRIPPVVRTADREEEEEEEGGTSSPNSTISSISGKHSSEREEQEAERACSRSISDEEDAENARKKLRLSKDQSVILEESFKDHCTLNPKQKMVLAKRLGLRPRQVEVWFQNRRARTKLKQTEVDYEFLKRCCENLTEENRRLHKEVQQLRALKLYPQTYMQMNPPTTLTMCPSCERVAPPLPPYSAAKMAPATAAAHPGPIAFGPWSTVARVPQRPFIALQYRQGPQPPLITPNF